MDFRGGSKPMHCPEKQYTPVPCIELDIEHNLIIEYTSIVIINPYEKEKGIIIFSCV